MPTAPGTGSLRDEHGHGAGEIDAPPWTEAPDQELMGLLFEVVGLVKEHFLGCIAALGLSPAQAHALRRLDPEHPVPMRELAAELRCDASTVTGLVDRLEDRGLVERRAASGDRRVKALVLTEPGIALRLELIGTLCRRLPEIVPLGDAERVELRDTLRRIVGTRSGHHGSPATGRRQDG